ncbi:MAG: CoA transferase [Bauldia sp.]
MAAVLEGIRVLDFTRVMAGPFATALLADVGAEVIKVEPPDGDDYRHIGPFKAGESGLFIQMNRGKRSITANLKSPEGLEAVKRLIAVSDVVIENFRPGVADRLGIGYEAVRAVNPRAVYVSISGFGQDGPLSGRPAYDLIAQAMAGMMSMTGERDGSPMRVGDALGDLASGLYGAWAIMVALHNRAQTGAGQRIDLAMFDAIFSLMPTPMSLLFYAGQIPTRNGNQHPISTPFGSFRASDGDVIIAVANNALFAALLKAIGRDDLTGDRRFADDASRTANEPALRTIIEDWSGTRTVVEVVAALDAGGIPASPIATFAEAANSAHARHRALIAEVVQPDAGRVPVIEQPVHFSGVERGHLRPAPRLGEHTDEVLASLAGYSAEDIARLRDSGAI